VADEALQWVAAEWPDGPDAGAPVGNRVVGAVAGGQRVVVCRAGGQLYALLDRCPHASEPLSGGRLRGFALECPYHGGRLDVRDGRPLAPPIRRPGQVLAVREVGGRIEIGLRRTPCTTS
jgi:3-phenylpropionate/trans-cinnamate dioxygenase ferredoxin subunit